MIPKILHQVWKTATLPPAMAGYAESWRRHNPDWEVRLWSDRELVDFVTAHYPHLLPTFSGYKAGVMRADAARYMLLDHFGGVYADIDCECLAPFAPIMAEDRLVLCEEPASHTRIQAAARTLPHFLFNGTMASPRAHPFWKHLLGYLPVTAASRDVLEATGPALLTSAAAAFDRPEGIAVHPPHLFAPTDVFGRSKLTEATLSIHHWAGTWYDKSQNFDPESRPGDRAVGLPERARRAFHKARHQLTQGETLSPEAARASVDPACLAQTAPGGGRIAVMVPLAGAGESIQPFLEAVATLDHPAAEMRLVFCHDDSVGTGETLGRTLEPYRGHFRHVAVLRKPPAGPERAGQTRRSRLSALAATRNHMIRRCLDAADDWALWIDPDVWRFPKDIVARLRAPGRRIVAPNCVIRPGGETFDTGSFVTVRGTDDSRYYRAMADGLYEAPPASVGRPRRLHLSDVRSRDLVELHGVGGSMLLVDAALHRGGLLFPELPYRALIDTEAFGQLARDLGVTPVGLPNVEVLRVPW